MRFNGVLAKSGTNLIVRFPVDVTVFALLRTGIEIVPNAVEREWSEFWWPKP